MGGHRTRILLHQESLESPAHHVGLSVRLTAVWRAPKLPTRYVSFCALKRRFPPARKSRLDRGRSNQLFDKLGANRPKDIALLVVTKTAACVGIIIDQSGWKCSISVYNRPKVVQPRHARKLLSPYTSPGQHEFRSVYRGHARLCWPGSTLADAKGDGRNIDARTYRHRYGRARSDARLDLNIESCGFGKPDLSLALDR